MPRDALDSPGSREAQREAVAGAVTGAARWGGVALLLGLGGHLLVPRYHGLTPQFKVYIQMSAMIVGGFVEGDRRLREHEAWVRSRRRIRRDVALWDLFDREWQNEEGEEPPPRPKHLQDEQKKEDDKKD